MSAAAPRCPLCGRDPGTVRVRSAGSQSVDDLRELAQLRAGACDDCAWSLGFSGDEYTDELELDVARVLELRARLGLTGGRPRQVREWKRRARAQARLRVAAKRLERERRSYAMRKAAFDTIERARGR